MAAEAALQGNFFIRFQQMRVFLDAQDLLLRTRNAVLGQQIILSAGMATSGSALTDVADLEAVQEVDETKSVH